VVRNWMRCGAVRARSTTPSRRSSSRYVAASAQLSSTAAGLAGDHCASACTACAKRRAQGSKERRCEPEKLTGTSEALHTCYRSNLTIYRLRPLLEGGSSGSCLCTLRGAGKEAEIRGHQHHDVFHGTLGGGHTCASGVTGTGDTGLPGAATKALGLWSTEAAVGATWL
jgi:hypothetical protein